jgi:diguanylate cyclase (GGDEF)-like protein/PAS domain S-box-containing protein
VARVRKNELANIVHTDEGVTQLLGWGPNEMVGKTSLDFIHPDDQHLAVDNWMQMLTSHGPGRAIRLRHRHRDGSWRWVQMTNHNLLDDPESNCILAEIVDISDQVAHGRESYRVSSYAKNTHETSEPVRLHEALRAREQLLHRLAEALPLGVLQLDVTGRVVYTNQMLHAILGPTRTTSVQEQFSAVVAEDRRTLDEALEGVLKGGLDTDIEVRLAAVDEDGHKELRQCTMSLRVLTADDGSVTGAIACVADVTESVRTREELRLRATVDQITQCHNRASTMEALDRVLSASDLAPRPAVIFVDLDHFKDVNDALGHAVGDELLAIVAKRLARAVRSDDLVGRIGGDEFLVVCPDISEREEAMRIAQRAARSLRQRVRLKNSQVSCQASIGVAWAEGAHEDADSLVSRADAAMYEAKRMGHGHPVFHRRAS